MEVKEGKGEEDKGKGIECGYMYGKKKKVYKKKRKCLACNQKGNNLFSPASKYKIFINQPVSAWISKKYVLIRGDLLHQNLCPLRIT